jgi:hypothetical protein
MLGEDVGKENKENTQENVTNTEKLNHIVKNVGRDSPPMRLLMT